MSNIETIDSDIIGYLCKEYPLSSNSLNFNATQNLLDHDAEPAVKTLKMRATENIAEFHKEKIRLLTIHLQNCKANIEKCILDNSRNCGKSSIEYNLYNNPIPKNNLFDKITDAEADNLITDILSWLRKQDMIVKQPYEKSSYINFRARLSISW